MRAVVINGVNRASISQVKKPIRKEGEALLEVLYGGICGSDMGLYKGRMTGYATYPRIPGHELAARIVEVDEDNVYGLKTGMIVTVNPYYNCGHCYSCERGYVNCCVDNKTMGLARDGVFAEYISIPLERIYDGKGLSAERLALIEPFAIAYHAVKRGNIKKGDRVLVVGSGTIGLFALLGAKIKGANVTVCDIAQGKLQTALALGADTIIFNDDNSKFSEKVSLATDGKGFDVAIEAVGFPNTLMNCIDAVASVGTVVEVGIGNQSLDFAYNIIQKKELTLVGSRNALKEDFDELIDLACKGEINLDAMISRIDDFTKAPMIFEELSANADNYIKTLLKFNN